MPNYWIAVASAAHVRLGRGEGFMQVSHGKAAPLKRIKPGDGVIYYSPTTVFGKKDALQSFTAIGTVKDGEPYQVEMKLAAGKNFKPFRRDVTWAKAKETPIAPLLDDLEFTAGKPNWGYQLRFGLFSVSAKDFRRIAKDMGAKF